MKTQPPVANGPVIFIADDDQLDDQYLYRQAFGEAGPSAVVYFFTHKAQLFDALRGDVFPEPSLLIMDWHMALQKGYVALTILAQAPAWQTIPVVVMATKYKPVDEARCQQLGYELVLPKETQ